MAMSHPWSSTLGFVFRVLLLAALCVAVHCNRNLETPVWPEVRNAPRDLDKRHEPHFGGGTAALAITADHEYFVTCGNDGEVNVYRVSRYPNIYKHWPHLYYAKMPPPIGTKLRGGAQIMVGGRLLQQHTCALAPNGAALFRLGRAGSGSTFRLVTDAAFDVNRLDNREGIVGTRPSWRSLEASGPLKDFHIVHPRDHFDFAWLGETAAKNIHRAGAKPDPLPPGATPDFFSLEIEHYRACTPVLAATIMGVVSPVHVDAEGAADKPAPWIVAAAVGSTIHIHTQGRNGTVSVDAGTGELGCVRSLFWYGQGRWLVAHAGSVIRAWQLTKTGAFVPRKLTWPAGETNDQHLVTAPVLAMVMVEPTVGWCRDVDAGGGSCGVVVSLHDTKHRADLAGASQGAGHPAGYLRVGGFSIEASGKAIQVRPWFVLGIKTSYWPTECFEYDGVLAMLAGSPDAKLIAFGCFISNNILIVPVSEGTVTGEHSVRALPGPPSSLALFQFESYYVAAAVGNSFALLASDQYPKPARKWPSARISDFYLPPTPLIADAAEQNGLPQAHPWLLFAVVAGVNLAMTLAPLLDPLLWRVSEHPVMQALGSLTTYRVAVAGLFAFSVFETFMQPAFVNDWPAHVRHVEHWLLDGTTDYDQIMHYHGPCTYPGGFMYFYAALYKVIGGSLQCYQLVWAGMEAATLLTLRSITDSARLPPWCSLLIVFSNRLHLFNVRVVVNDLPPTLLSLLATRAVLSQRWLVSSLLWSLALSQKLNIVLFAPSVLMVYIHRLGVARTFFPHGAVVVAVQAALAWPFAATNWQGYVAHAYDFGRTLLWDKTRTFRWIGRSMYENPIFVTLTYCLGIVVFGVVLCRWAAATKRPPTARRVLAALVASNLAMCLTARGLYTPMLCWFFYTVPAACYMANMGLAGTTLVWGAIEVLWRVLGSHEREMWASLVLFAVSTQVCTHLCLQHFGPDGEDTTHVDAWTDIPFDKVADGPSQADAGTGASEASSGTKQHSPSKQRRGGAKRKGD